MSLFRQHSSLTPYTLRRGHINKNKMLLRTTTGSIPNIKEMKVGVYDAFVQEKMTTIHLRRLKIK